MEPGAGSTENEVPLWKLHVEGNGHLETGREPEPPRKYKKRTILLAVALTIVFLGLLIAVIVLTVWPTKLPSADLSLPAGPACPDGWVGYRGKCYYFSNAEGNWNHSQSHCSSLGASLADIETLQDLGFMLRYKGGFDHWIGLWRDTGQPWKWASGTEFNHLFEIRGDGDCAYLNDENGVSSSRCIGERDWICTKPNAFTKAKRSPVEGGS